MSKTLNIYKKTAQGTCGDWFTCIWGTEQECLDIAGNYWSDYLWAWEK